MCGIVGYIGKKEAYPILIKGLRRLEYRGYDSAGVALINNEGNLNVYKTMITVSGVGPKAALGILGTLSANDIRFAVFSDDFKAISRAPGVGPKTAKKLILELKDKLKLEDALGNLQQEDIPAAGPAAAAAADAEINDAVQALVALGYSSSEALRAVRKVKITEEMQTQDILKQALKYIGI